MATKETDSKRTLIASKDDKRYIRRDEKGQIKQSDDQGRSLCQAGPYVRMQNKQPRKRCRLDKAIAATKSATSNTIGSLYFL